VSGAVILGLFALDLGIAAWGAPAAVTLRGPADVFSSLAGLHTAVDLCGLAVGGGLFIVPAFAAVQAWSDVAFRARTIAAVNILNAAFMTGATIAVAVLQKAGVGVPMLFLGVGAATLLVAAAIRTTMPKAR